MRRVLKLHLIMTQSDCPEVTMCSGQGVKKEGRKKEEEKWLLTSSSLLNQNHMTLYKSVNYSFLLLESHILYQ